MYFLLNSLNKCEVVLKSMKHKKQAFFHVDILKESCIHVVRSVVKMSSVQSLIMECRCKCVGLDWLQASVFLHKLPAEKVAQSPADWKGGLPMLARHLCVLLLMRWRGQSNQSDRMQLGTDEITWTNISFRVELQRDRTAVGFHYQINVLRTNRLAFSVVFLKHFCAL